MCVFTQEQCTNFMLFISKLSSVTVGFRVKNGFGMFCKGCHTIFKQF